MGLDHDRLSLARLIQAIAAFGTASWFVLVNALLLMGSAIYAAISAPDSEAHRIVRENVVPALSCVVFTQILMELVIIKQRLEELRGTLNPPDGVVFPPETVDEEIRGILASGRAHSVQIICYGTNKFGKLIDFIQDRVSHIRTDVVVCSPQCSSIPKLSRA